MELFSLLAKLTLDKKEFDSAISEAESEARGIDIENPSLGLDDDEFYDKIDDAESTDVEDPEDPQLGLDKQEFDDNIAEAEQSGEQFSSNLGAIFNELKGVLVASGIVAAVSGVVASLKEGVELAKNHGDQIDKQSQKMMISKKAYQEYAYALGLSGASIDDLNKGMRNLQKIPGEGLTDKQIAAFEALGISADEAMAQITEGMAKEDLTGFVDRIVSAIADADSADQGWIAAALFGNGATGLNAFFNQTSKQIRDAKNEAEELGYVMSDAEVANAAAYMDATTRLESSINGLKESLVADLLPYLTDAANTIAKIIAFFNPRTGQKSLSEQWAGDDKAFAEELLTIEGTAAAAESLAEKLLSMGDTSKMTADQYAIWKGTAEELINLVPSLGEVIDTETGQINGNSESIRENIKEWENLAKQKALQTLKEKKYQDIISKNESLIDKSVEANKKAAEAEKARVEATDKFSRKMQEYGLGSLDMNGDIDQQISDVMSRLSEGGEQYESELLGLGVALKEFGEATTEAGKAQAEVDKLTEELKKGEEEYKSWLATAEEMYGVQFEEAKSAKDETQKYKKVLESIPNNVHTTFEIEYEELNPRPHAIGSAYIPWDNYPALLHRGEKILTATEARRGTGDGIDYTALEDRITAAIRAGMEGVTVQSYLNGRDITDDVNRDTGRQLKARRFRG